MLRTSELEMADTYHDEDVDTFITNAAWAIRSTYHTVLKSSPGAAIFGRDMLFDLPYIADWTAIGQRRQRKTDRENLKENAKRVDFDYQVGQKVMLINDGKILRKAESKYLGPFMTMNIHTNGNILIQKGSISDCLNVRRVIPYFE